MGSIPNNFPISLRSWPSSTKPAEGPDLKTLFGRINSERGGFRNLTEESLRQEIAEEEANKPEEDEEEGSDKQDEDVEPDRMKELMAAREELIAQGESAFNSAAYALDFVSLLLSKNMPNSASQTVSPALKDMVGMGVLGADKLHTPRITEDQKQENMRIAKGWKLQNLSKTVDTILTAATRLEKEIESETKYWEEVLAVSNKGWAICRIPSEKQTLGVRFGFSEASLTFKNQSLAALRRNADGSIFLDQGFSGTEPQALRVQIHTNGSATGSSPMPKLVEPDSPVEALILQARNTIFDTELWQELNRESRALGGVDVTSVGDSLVLSLNSTKSIVVDMVPLGEAVSPPPGPDDAIARGICLSLQLLLSYAHRQVHRRRTQPPPPISGNKRPNPPYNLFRPLLARLNHQRSISSINSLLLNIASILRSAAVSPEPTYKLVHSTPPAPTNMQKAELTVYSLTDRMESVASLAITPTTTITISSRTMQFPVSTSYYQITLNPESPLLTLCPPTQVLNTFGHVEEYVLYATSCALASSLATTLSPVDDDEISSSAPGKDGWHAMPRPNILKKVFEGGKVKHLTFKLDNPEKGSGLKHMRLSVAWDWELAVVDGSDGKESRRSVTKAEGEGIYEWKTKKTGTSWNDGEGEVARSLTDVVEAAGKLPKTASSGRAVCKATDCNKNKIKIGKDELRFGVWVETKDYSSWAWKHWGCMTGKQLQNLRNYLQVEGQPGTYDWDKLDGYDGHDNEKNSLDHHPDLQEKVRRVVTQGFIDPEDFNGDSEMNVLGATGLLSAASKKQRKEEAKEKKQENGESTDDVTKVKNEKNVVKAESSEEPVSKPVKKGKRVKNEVVSDEEEQKPPKKKRANKVKKEEADDQKEVASKPARNSRAKKAIKDEDDEDHEKVKDEDASEAGDMDGSSLVWSSMTVPQLKVHLQERNLATSGKKGELIKRLEESSTLPTPPKKETTGRKKIKQESDGNKAEARLVKDEPNEKGADMRGSPANVETMSIKEEASPSSAAAEHGSFEQESMEPKKEEAEEKPVAKAKAPVVGRRRSARQSVPTLPVD
ncbi:hypothetical protein HYFRA_00000036 [Hymenoscyphus fraxineus]|uniref:Mediator of RNA polymerase II transcription subunit 17 n=1 Tax=Hymenoscyphus fraxineus TaxID=746836 RepID=A0A9N9L0V9_9HELO|nr:hypothetical protein HYFRA_00000036 [Hymenoscyphus fraxineus]